MLPAQHDDDDIEQFLEPTKEQLYGHLPPIFKTVGVASVGIASVCTTSVGIASVGITSVGITSVGIASVYVLHII